MNKFKLLATQCSISDTPTQSPTTSPVFHLRRHRHRKTLRMFLSRSTDSLPSPPPPDKRGRRKLKDLFISSSPPPIDHASHHRSITNQIGPTGDGLPARRRAMTSSGSFRYRFLLRRAWRPVLITIPEID